MQENLLTIEQVAQYLTVDKLTIYRLVAQQRIPAFKVGNQWRIKREMLEDWLKTNCNMNKEF